MEMLGDLIAKFLSEKSKEYDIDKDKLVIDSQYGDIRLLKYDEGAYSKWKFLEFIQQTKE